MKIAVYGIAKNEAKHVARFMETAREADEVVILDCGSTDNTVELFRQEGAIVRQNDLTVGEHGFARCRTAALHAVDATVDFCVSLDIDEVLSPGWRKALEKSIAGNTNMVRVKLHCSDTYAFWCQRIHSRQGWQWRHMIHEALYADGPLHEAYNSHVTITHKQDFTKDRSQYLPLLEKAVREEPTSNRMKFYLAREYGFKRQWADALKVAAAYMLDPVGKWKEEHAAMYCIQGTAFAETGQLQLAEAAFKSAIRLVPGIREPWVLLARHCWVAKDWVAGYLAARRALEITDNEEQGAWSGIGWGVVPPDIAGLCAYEMGLFSEARTFFEMAITIEPTVQRHKDNLAWAMKNLG